MIKAGIIGGSGYVAGELIRCLVHHPDVTVDFIYSHSQADAAVHSIHDDLIGNPEIKLSNAINPEADVVFLCLGHGNSKKFLETHTFSQTTKIIDLSNDFRLPSTAQFKEYKFVYGLTSMNKPQITRAQAIANPGCFATAIQQALLPLAATGQLNAAVHIHAITGSTGAGQAKTETTHFSWRNNNISIYKAFEHQHLDEISNSISSLQPDFEHELNFIPVRGDFTRGIFATCYLDSQLSQAELSELFQSYYEKDPYTVISSQSVHLKQVVNTNNCFLQVEKKGSKVLITSVIDNLLKGAAGQAIQNMNLMFGLDETSGLQLKASYF